MTPHRTVTIHVGDVIAERVATEIKTVVGSCIAVCLIDRRAQVAGMNHFMLPASVHNGRDAEDRARFGVHAMDLLIGAMLKAGADRHAMVAKVFGGAHVLLVPESAMSIPQCNIRFVDEFMAAEGIPVVSRDVGGYLPRRLHLHTDSGKVFVHRLGQQALQHAQLQERRHMQVIRQTGGPVGDVTLFDHPVDR
jgi:chemotaxis protein CheD